MCRLGCERRFPGGGELDTAKREVDRWAHVADDVREGMVMARYKKFR